MAKDEYTAVTALGDCTSLLWRLEQLKNPVLHPTMPNSQLPPNAYTRSTSTSTSTSTSSSSSSSGRWSALAARWAPYLPSQDVCTSPAAPWWPVAGARAASASHSTRWYSWNDVHAVMALSMAAAREGDAAAGQRCESLLAEMAAVAQRCGGGGLSPAAAALPTPEADAAWLSATVAAIGIARPQALFAALGSSGRGSSGSGSGSGSGGSGSSRGGSDSDAASEQARLTALVGLDTALGCAAFARGEWAGAVAHLTAASPHWQRLGGSHVQRDVFEATLLDALSSLAHASKAAGGSSSSSSSTSSVGGGGPTGAACRMLASARVTLKPQSPRRWWGLGTALEASGEGFAEGALGAKNRAHALGLNQGPGY